MLYRDLIYGEVNIDEPIILDLINSRSVQRLKKIDQAGYRQPWIKPELRVNSYEESRFSHSVGVYLLLKNYGASLEEQVTGLIHDVSHAVFSHCIDYVLSLGSEKNQSHQDNIFEEFVKKSEIPEILKKYNFDLDYILSDKNFPLKEKNLPDLCADRIDYSLRREFIFKEINKENVDYLLNNLITQNSEWVFKNFESAKKFSELFLKLNIKYFTSLGSALMYRTVGDYLKYAVEKGYVDESDFYTTDSEVLEKTEKYHNKDEKLKLLFDRMNNKIGFTNNPEDFESHIYCKSRVVNPLFFDNGKILRVSDVDKEWRRIVQEELRPKEYFLKFDK